MRSRPCNENLRFARQEHIGEMERAISFVEFGGELGFAFAGAALAKQIEGCCADCDETKGAGEENIGNALRLQRGGKFLRLRKGRGGMHKGECRSAARRAQPVPQPRPKCHCPSPQIWPVIQRPCSANQCTLLVAGLPEEVVNEMKMPPCASNGGIESKLQQSRMCRVLLSSGSARAYRGPAAAGRDI